MKDSFLKNGFYNTAGGIIRIGLAILTIPLLIRLIGVEEYGLWTLASSVIAIVGLAEAGLATATTVFVSQDLGKEDSDGLSQTLTVTVGAMLILATIAAFALWFGAEGIVSIFTKLDNTQQLTGGKSFTDWWISIVVAITSTGFSWCGASISALWFDESAKYDSVCTNYTGNVSDSLQRRTDNSIDAVASCCCCSSFVEPCLGGAIIT